ncbi:MAG: MerR family mercuric resistance operon transcriptional regulator [Parasphingorhabdus sp.]
MASFINCTIGKLAIASQVNIETIRYYHRKGLLPEPEKPQQGFRVYGEQHYARICFIRKSQQLGFTLNEIAQLLSLSDGDCSEVRSIAKAKLITIQSKLTDLSRLEHVLTELVDACDSNANPTQCPIIESLVLNTVE